MNAAASAAAVLTLGVALLCWPGAAAPRRLERWRGGAVDPRRGLATNVAGRRPTVRPGAVAVGAAALGLAVAGVGGALAAVTGTVVVVRTRRATRRTRERADATHSLSEALGTVAAELRAGSPPAAAARAAAADRGGLPARALALVEATARLGGDVPTALRGLARDGAPGADDLRRLATAWGLAERHGIGLAGLVEAVAVDLGARSRAAGRLRAQVAGPRATAVVLALLPVLGVALGEGIGAHPWSVLAGTGAGQVLLVVGTALVGAGIEWTERIVAGVAR